jgi:hypothetical protein
MKTRNQSVAFLFILIAIFVYDTSAFGQRPEPKKTMVKGHLLYTVLKPGDIPAIFDPEFIPISQGDEYYHPEEPLMTVVYGDSAKAYSTWHLDRHEIVNDRLNGRAIAVTW